MQILCFTG